MLRSFSKAYGNPTRALRPLLYGALVIIAVTACSGRSSAPIVSPTPTTNATATPVPSPQVAGQPGIVDVVFINPTQGWLVRGANGQGELLVTDDGGTSWTVRYKSQMTPQIIQFVDTNNGWLASCVLPVGSSGDCQTRLLATRDGGNTWTPAASAPVTQGKVVAIGFVSPQDGWVLGERCLPLCDSQAPAQLFRTQDGATTWEPMPVFDGVTAPVSLQRLDEHVGWVLTKNNVFGTRDGGVTWTTAENPCNAVQPGGKRMFLSGPMSFADEHVGWIGCYFPIGAGTAAGALYRTGDGGATWHLVGLTPEGGEALPSGVGRFPTGVVDLDFLNEQDGWFACGCPQSGVWRTHNGGRVWDLVDVGLSGVGHVLFVDDAHGWAWGFGTLLRTIDGGAHWQKVELPP